MTPPIRPERGALSREDYTWLRSQGYSDDDLIRDGLTPPPTRPMRNAGLGAVQGMTMGLADEIAGVGDAATLGLGRAVRDRSLARIPEAYVEARDAARGLYDEARTETPAAYTAGNLVGMGATSIGAGGIGAIGRLSAARGGAVLGAAQGFGEGEGLGGSVAGAAGGAALGAAAGKLAEAVVPPVARGVASARGAINRLAGQASPRLTQPAGAGVRALLGRPVAADATAAPGMALARTGGALVPRATQADAAAGVEVPVLGSGALSGGVPTTAQRRVLNAMRADRLSVDDAMQADPRLTLMDAGEEALRREGRRSVNMSPDAATPMQQGARGRVVDSRQWVDDALTAGTGQQRVNLFDTVDDAVAKRSALADPLYEAARAQPFPEALLPEFNQLMTVPQFRRAYQYAQDIDRVAGKAVPEFADPDAMPIPTIETVDRMKRGVDRIIRGDLEREGISREMGRAMAGRLRGFLGQLDQAVPEYGQARQVFAGASELIDAFETGAKLATRSPDEIANVLGKMTEGEAEAARAGLAQAKRAHMDNVRDTGDLAARIFGSPAQRAQWRQVFPDEASFNEFAALVEGPVTRVQRTANALRGNSTTAQQGADMLDGMGQTVSRGARRLTDYVRSPMAAVGDAVDVLGARFDRGTARDVGLNFLNLTGPERNQMLRALAALEGPESARQGAARRTGRALGALMAPTPRR